MSQHVETFQSLVAAELALAQRIKVRLGVPVAHPNEAVDASRTAGERIADRVAEVAGSWSFIGVFVAVLGAWITVNLLLGPGAFDVYPFILLNLVLSTIAALQAPVIMMSQNRQAKRDRARADLDFRINVRAEGEIAALQTEMEELRTQQLGALMLIQQEQLVLLRHIVGERGAAAGTTGRSASD